MQIGLKSVHYVITLPTLPNAVEPNAVEANAVEANAVEANAVEANAVERRLKNNFPHPPRAPLYSSTTTTTSGASSSASSTQRTATWCCRPSGPRTANQPSADAADGDARCPPALAVANNFLRLARTLNAVSVAMSASAPAMKHAITRTVAARSTPDAESTASSQSDDDVAFILASPDARSR